LYNVHVILANICVTRSGTMHLTLSCEVHRSQIVLFGQPENDGRCVHIRFLTCVCSVHDFDSVTPLFSKLPSSNELGIATDQRACAASTAKQSCYAVYDDAGNNLNIHSLLKFKFYLTDDLMINEINAVWHVSLWFAAPVSSSHDTGRSLDTTRRLISVTFILF
jgi:hypothetical protein